MSPEEKLRKNIYIFLGCLVFSGFIWMLIVLSKNYPATLQVSIEYDKVPNNLFFVHEPETGITLRLETTGWEIFKYRYWRKRPVITIDLSNLRLKKENGSYIATVSTSQYKAEIEEKTRLQNVFMEFIPSVIQLEFVSVVSKKVSVEVDLTMTFRRQYELYDTIRVVPDSVLLFGSAENIDNIEFVITEPVVLEDLDRDTRVQAKVILPFDNGIRRIVPEDVDIFLPVGEFTEGTVEVPVQIKNSAGMRFKTFPSTATLVYHVPLRDYPRVRREMFEVSAFYSENDHKGDNKLPLRITGKPPFTNVVKVSPDNVEYIILKDSL